MLRKAIVNARIITETSVLTEHAVVFGNKIEQIVPCQQLDLTGAIECIDAEGRFLSPGFIDLHVHGCAGVDVMDQADGSMQTISRTLPQTGVTAFLPTTMTMQWDRIILALERIRAAMYQNNGACVLGCHLEGPFISPAYPGAQDAAHILQPDFRLIAAFDDVIKMITLAPECLGAQSVIRACAAAQIVVSMGHSGACYDEAVQAIAAGASHITHTFNAMPLFHHRNPGILGAAFENSTVSCELIADNIHVHPAVQRMLLAVKGSRQIILVTDAMRASLLGAGRYDLGGQAVIVEGQAARLPSGVLAGSVLTLNKAVYHFKNNTGLHLAEAVRLASLNPARRLGVEGVKGSIAVGKDADLVLLDDDFTVQATFVGGKLIYWRV